MDRVGLLTIHDTMNFGSLLQTFATVSFLKKRIPTVELIDYKCSAIEKRETVLSLRDAKTPKAVLKYVLLHNVLKTKRNNFQSFLQQVIPFSPRYDDTNMIYEDYYLWIRMIMNGATFANIPEVLVFVRTDENRYKRKGSKTYIASTKKFQHYLYGVGFINKIEYFRNKYGRLFVAYIPVCFRKIVYEKILREKPSAERKNEYE